MASTLFSDYLICDVIANRPASPSFAAHVTGIFYATDTLAAYLWNGSAWVAFPGGGGGGGSVTASSSQLSADVVMTSSGTDYDGPTLSLGLGSYLLVAAICIDANSTPAHIVGKLWDGTTVAGSSEETLTNVGTMTLAALVAPGSTTTYKFTANNNTAGGAHIKAAATFGGVGNNASTLIALKYA